LLRGDDVVLGGLLRLGQALLRIVDRLAGDREILG